MKIVREKLSKQTLKEIEKKIILSKRVYEFIGEAQIPHSSYYMAINGGSIKSNHHQKIVQKLKEF